ncbi:MAG: DUF6531 domain-containing protein [bacterium]
MSVLRTSSDRVLLAVALAGALWAAHLTVPRLERGTSGGVALVDRPAGAYAIDGDPVDLGTGLFVREDDDLAVSGPPPIRVRRTYRSNDPRPRAFGIGTSHLYDRFLVGDATGYAWVAMILPDGGRIDYIRVSPGTGQADAVLEHTSSPTEYYKSRLAWNGKGWHVTLQDGQRYAFSACDAKSRCALIEYRDREGRALTMSRDAAGDLTGITARGGGGIRLANDAAHRITRANMAADSAHVVTYHYDAQGRLIKMQKRGGALLVVKEYTYDEAHRMLTVNEPGFRLTNTYDQGGRVIGQDTSTRQPFRFRYVLDKQGKISQTDVTYPDGSLRRVAFNAQGYAATETYAPGTPNERTIVYEREVGSNRVRTITLSCAVGGRSQKMSASVGAADTVDGIRSELLARCR